MMMKLTAVCKITSYELKTFFTYLYIEVTLLYDSGAGPGGCEVRDTRDSRHTSHESWNIADLGILYCSEYIFAAVHQSTVLYCAGIAGP